VNIAFRALMAAPLAIAFLGCQPARTHVQATDRMAIRSALRAAWRAYTVESPSERQSTEAGLTEAARGESVARYEAEGNAAIAALDSAVAVLPAEPRANRRYLSETLAGLVSTLRDRQNSELAILQGIRDQGRGIYVDEGTGTAMLRKSALPSTASSGWPHGSADF
jgi:hypothetical protein